MKVLPNLEILPPETIEGNVYTSRGEHHKARVPTQLQPEYWVWKKHAWDLCKGNNPNCRLGRSLTKWETKWEGTDSRELLKCTILQWTVDRVFQK